MTSQLLGRHLGAGIPAQLLLCPYPHSIKSHFRLTARSTNVGPREQNDRYDALSQPDILRFGYRFKESCSCDCVPFRRGTGTRSGSASSLTRKRDLRMDKAELSPEDYRDSGFGSPRSGFGQNPYVEKKPRQDLHRRWSPR